MSGDSVSMLEQRLCAEAGLDRAVGRCLASLVAQPAGLIVICGPAGAGKTLLGGLLAHVMDKQVSFLGDLGTADEIRDALVAAARALTVCVVRSGQSHGLRLRWEGMGIEPEIFQAAHVVTVTIRKLRAVFGSGWPESGPRPLIAEVLAPDGSAPVGSLVDQARDLVRLGVVDQAEAEWMVPDYPR